MPRKYVQTDGLATLVHHRGKTTLPGTPPDTSTGRVVVFLHDAGGNGNCFAALMDALSDRHSPISFDQPGHGRSGGLDSLGSIEAMAAHAESVLGSWGLSDVVLLGEGMGASVALEMAARGNTPVAGVVAVGTVGLAPDLSDEIAELAAITAGKARRQFDQSGYAPDTPREVYGAAFGEWVKTDPRATVEDRRGQEDWDGLSRAADVSCPVTVVIGEHTEGSYRAMAEEIAQSTGGRTVELAGAGRHGVIEQPAALAELIDEFTSGLGGAA